MSRCPVNDLILYAYGELEDPEREAALFAHLRTCKSCQEELEFLRNLQRGDLEEGAKPPPVAVPPLRAPVHWRFHWLRVAAGILLFLFAAGTTWWLTTQRQDKSAFDRAVQNEILLAAQTDSLMAALRNLNLAFPGLDSGSVLADCAGTEVLSLLGNAERLLSDLRDDFQAHSGSQKEVIFQ
ncbi:MAG: hypothetical protein GXO73_07745 [Calditrichaeota bacterium]|nr:hypothetical protein [Calditrichota bacterium]